MENETNTEMTEGAIADLKAVLDYSDEMRSADDRQRRLLAHASMTTVERVRRNLQVLHNEFDLIRAGEEASPEEQHESIEIEVPEVEYNRDDPLHRGAIALHGDRTDSLHKAMLLLSESNDLLTEIFELDESGAVWATMVKDVRRRVRKALKALDEQEQADKDVYLAFAETQRSSS